MMKPLIAVVMGSKSDLETMSHATAALDLLGAPYEVKILSAHRAPDLVFEYAAAAESRGIEVIIAAAGGAAHLAGVIAAKTVLPVLGVPMHTSALHGMDSLLSTVQMPEGVPVGTMAIGKAGAVNAAILASSIVGIKHGKIREAVRRFREEQTRKVAAAQDAVQPAND